MSPSFILFSYKVIRHDRQWAVVHLSGDKMVDIPDSTQSKLILSLSTERCFDKRKLRKRVSITHTNQTTGMAKDVGMDPQALPSLCTELSAALEAAHMKETPAPMANIPAWVPITMLTLSYVAFTLLLFLSFIIPILILNVIQMIACTILGIVMIMRSAIVPGDWAWAALDSAIVRINSEGRPYTVKIADHVTANTAINAINFAGWLEVTPRQDTLPSAPPAPVAPPDMSNDNPYAYNDTPYNLV